MLRLAGCGLIAAWLAAASPARAQEGKPSIPLELWPAGAPGEPGGVGE
jgi:hypothetical protein